MALLAVTGGLGFLGTAALAYAHGHWALTWTSAALGATSVLWHSTRNTILWATDQVAMFAFAGAVAYESHERGALPLAMFVASGTYCTVVFWLGKRWRCWAFHPTEDRYYHATLHLLPLFNLIALFSFFPKNNEDVPDLLFLPEGDRGPSAGPRLLEG